MELIELTEEEAPLRTIGIESHGLTCGLLTQQELAPEPSPAASGARAAEPGPPHRQTRFPSRRCHESPSLARPHHHSPSRHGSSSCEAARVTRDPTGRCTAVAMPVVSRAALTVASRARPSRRPRPLDTPPDVFPGGHLRYRGVGELAAAIALRFWGCTRATSNRGGQREQRNNRKRGPRYIATKGRLTVMTMSLALI